MGSRTWLFLSSAVRVRVRFMGRGRGRGRVGVAHVALLVERRLELLVRVEHQPQVGRAAYPDELLRVLVEDLEQRGPAGAQVARCGRDAGEI